MDRINEVGELATADLEMVFQNDEKEKERPPAEKEVERIGHLAAIVESSEDAIISKSLTGIIRSWNKGSEKMFGYTANQAIGKHISLIIPRTYVDEEKGILDKIRNNEIIDHFETVRNNKNGEHVYVSLTVSPIKDQEGKIIGVSKIARDISSRKKAEAELIIANMELAFQNKEKEKQAAELKKSNERFFKIFENNLIGMIITNLETFRFQYVNDHFLSTFGYTKEELINKTALELNLVEPESSEKVLTLLKLQGYAKDIEVLGRKKNGELALCLSSIQVITFSDQQFALTSFHDITERKKMEAELKIKSEELAFQNEEKEKRAEELILANIELVFQNKEKETMAAELLHANQKLSVQNENRLKEISDYKHALDESSILAITDQKGIIRYVNDNFCKISKYTANELIGEDHRILNSGYHPKEFIRNLWGAIANGKIWRGELKNKAKDGTFYWVDTTIIPFLNDQGKPYQYAAIRSDITLRKQAEEEVKILNEELEQRVKERTEDLESFSYSVSHDLRAPLRAINGYAKMFKKGYESQFDTEGNRLINNIVDNAAKMGQLIDDLLTFSRLGRREMTGIKISMHEIVSNLCRELKGENGDRIIEFDIRELPSVKADNIGIKQVWLNLISNAVKYSKLKEKAVIEIGSEIKGDEIIYYVKDNGVGFDMLYVSKLFNIFQRLHSDEEFEGTGIGLAIVQRIIEKHGGKVWAEGKVNEKAIFYFSLRKS